MAKKKSFVLSDESLNSYGFRVLTSGIDLGRFLKNPVMLWNHHRTFFGGSEDVILPIGIWENLRVSEGKLLGDACFDCEDPFAARIANKVDKGFIRACSIGIEVLERSELPEHVLQGQTRMTVTRCMLREVSFTDIPANGNAVALYDSGGAVIKEDELSLALPLLGGTMGTMGAMGGVSRDFININTGEKMKLIALKLGLSENAGEAEIVAKLEELLSLRSKLTEADNEVSRLKASALEAEKKIIDKMVNDAVLSGKLTADRKASFVGIGETMGVAVLEATLGSMNSAVRPTDLLGGTGYRVQGTGLSDGKKWGDYSSGELEILRSEDRSVYSALFEAEYGFRPEL